MHLANSFKPTADMRSCSELALVANVYCQARPVGIQRDELQALKN